MPQTGYDVVVIGAGTAGLSARAAAVEAGARVLLVEEGPGGTTCARSGCMPSKLLIAAAAAAHGARSAAPFGVRVGEVRVEGAAVMRRVQAERDRFVRGVLDDVETIAAADRRHGHARFVAPGRLEIEGVGEIGAKAVVIATGARSRVPPELEAVRSLVLTNDSVFELADLPRSLAVIGAGALGLELAQAFARLGVRVAVFDTAERIAGISDPEVATVAADILATEIDLHLQTGISARPEGDGVALSWTGPRGSGGARFDRVLAAAGRPPHFEGLALDRAGLECDRHGVPVFDPATMQCGASAVFLAGDADRDRPVLHEASDEGRIAGRNAARFPRVESQTRRIPLAITYTDPEIARVGGGWHGLDLPRTVVGSADLRGSGRARVMGRNAGLLRIYAREQDGLLLGAEMVGPEVEHLAHLVAWIVQLGLRAEDALALPFYHPTLEESLRTALRELCKATGSGGALSGYQVPVG